ncbi:hypothetical protein C4D60_Mb06t15260 [Musa balbisiana]|uniref:Uncharacterized protein n=1 Tax=Musa balbisiana TaxID=52838 RepID=A0A4S8INX6_MUSBA|nr:hypothetical protein C4D60_Mb06t15260 [Musa balbisiana]
MSKHHDKLAKALLVYYDLLAFWMTILSTNPTARLDYFGWKQKPLLSSDSILEFIAAQHA